MSFMEDALVAFMEQVGVAEAADAAPAHGGGTAR
jgi:hypothetical protein